MWHALHTVQTSIIRITEILFVKFFFISVHVVQLWNKLPKKWYQPAVSVLLCPIEIQCMCRFLTFRFSAESFFIYVSFKAVVSAFWAFLFSRPSSALYCFYGIVSVLRNKIFIHSFLPGGRRQFPWQQREHHGFSCASFATQTCHMWSHIWWRHTHKRYHRFFISF